MKALPENSTLLTQASICTLPKQLEANPDFVGNKNSEKGRIAIDDHSQLTHIAETAADKIQTIQNKAIGRLSPSLLEASNHMFANINALRRVRAVATHKSQYQLIDTCDGNASNHVHGKTLVFRNKKNKVVAFVLDMKDQVNTKSPDFKKSLPTGGGRSMLSSIEEKIGYISGGVNPFLKDIPVVIDKSLQHAATLVVGGGSPDKQLLIDAQLLNQLSSGVSFGDFAIPK